MANGRAAPQAVSDGGHDWASGHRLTAPRRGPIVSARSLDVSDLRPEEAFVVAPGATGPVDPTRLASLRERLVGDGWSVSDRTSGANAPELLAERDLLLDVTALRNVHLVQLACAVEFGGAIALGFLWPAFGHPVWQGEAITAAAVLGAIGLVAILARVDFVSLVLVVERLPERPTAPDGARPTGPWRLVWARRVWSRNWEVLGDRGGRAVVRSRRTPASDVAAQSASAHLTEPTSGLTRTSGEFARDPRPAG